ncbi:MAG: hypothetical protein SFX18_05050 [Pirellulales bacterium]|nr:hypothetical protein [Pirellulales bacterium]
MKAAWRQLAALGTLCGALGYGLDNISPAAYGQMNSPRAGSVSPERSNPRPTHAPQRQNLLAQADTNPFGDLGNIADEATQPPAAAVPDRALPTPPTPTAPSVKSNNKTAQPQLAEPDGMPPKPLFQAPGSTSPATVVSEPHVMEEYLPPQFGETVYEPGSPCADGNCDEFGQPAEPWSSGSWFFNGRRYAQLDFVMFHRTRPDERQILGTEFAPGLQTAPVINTYGQKWGAEPGLRATYGMLLERDYLNRDRSLEFTFLGVNEFEMQDGLQTRSDDNLILLPNLALPGFNAADQWTLDTRSRISSMELNYKLRRRLGRDRMIMNPDGSWSRQFTQGNTPSLILGLRYVSLEEDFVWRSRQFENPASVFGVDYTIETDNDLFGVQIGGEWFDQRETWYWGVRGKGAALLNMASQTSDYVFAGFDPFQTKATQNVAGFLAEFSLLGAYHLSPNCTLRGSYDILVFGGLATAQEQIRFDFSPPARIDTTSNIFLQSVSLGLEFFW